MDLLWIIYEIISDTWRRQARREYQPFRVPAIHGKVLRWKSGYYGIEEIRGAKVQKNSAFYFIAVAIFFAVIKKFIDLLHISPLV